MGVVFRSIPVKDFSVIFCFHGDVWDCDGVWFGTYFVHVGGIITITSSIGYFIKNGLHLIHLLVLLN
jgi:hypothetical protein